LGGPGQDRLALAREGRAVHGVFASPSAHVACARRHGRNGSLSCMQAAPLSTCVHTPAASLAPRFPPPSCLAGHPRGACSAAGRLPLPADHPDNAPPERQRRRRHCRLRASPSQLYLRVVAQGPSHPTTHPTTPHLSLPLYYCPAGRLYFVCCGLCTVCCRSPAKTNVIPSLFPPALALASPSLPAHMPLASRRLPWRCCAVLYRPCIATLFTAASHYITTTGVSPPFGPCSAPPVCRPSLLPCPLQTFAESTLSLFGLSLASLSARQLAPHLSCEPVRLSCCCALPFCASFASTRL